MLGGRRAWWRSGRGQDIELAGEVGEGVHGREADAEEGGLEDGGDGEGEEVEGERGGPERRLVKAVECPLRLSPRARGGVT